MIDKTTTRELTISRQCELLDINRTSAYVPNTSEFSKADIEIMNKIDEIFTDSPELGYRRIFLKLVKAGIDIGRDKTLKFMRNMGVCAIYPKKKTTFHNKKNKIYPYLLRGIKIIRPNQVWAADITYIRMSQGFCYLVVIMDIFSRKILSYRISNSLDSQFCIDALLEALEKYPAPEIFNTDQGCQFTSESFTEILINKNIKISMNSKGRALDNIFVERFFRTLKYENIYIYNYESMLTLIEGLNYFFHKYNCLREHSSLANLCPEQVYYGNEEVLNLVLKKGKVA